MDNGSRAETANRVFDFLSDGHVEVNGHRIAAQLEHQVSSNEPAASGNDDAPVVPEVGRTTIRVFPLPRLSRAI